MSSHAAATVSVIIPTHRRQEMMRRAVASVLTQEIPAGYALEVVIGVSDPRVTEDLAAAEEIAAADARVRVAHGPRRGAGGTRNSAIAVADGEFLAFIDDDCEAQPGWLVAALAAIESADLVQGTTRPATDVPKYHHSIWVTPPSWLWETCNLMVRRVFAERVGLFNEDWNREGRAGNLFQFGEDAEMGWRMIRAGARPAYAPEAVVHHAVFPRTRRDYLKYKAGIRRFPRLFRTTPEVRRIFYAGYFVNERHVVLTGAAVAAGAALVFGLRDQRVPAAAAGLGAALAVISPARGLLTSGHPRSAVRLLMERVPEDMVEFWCAVYGSIRWRRVLL